MYVYFINTCLLILLLLFLTVSIYPRFLQRLAELMEEHKEELATIESLDSGAVYTLALKTHIGMSIDTMRYFAGWADKIQVKLKENSLPNFFLNQENNTSTLYAQYFASESMKFMVLTRYVNFFCAKTIDFLITQRPKLSHRWLSTTLLL